MEHNKHPDEPFTPGLPLAPLADLLVVSKTTGHDTESAFPLRLGHTRDFPSPAPREVGCLLDHWLPHPTVAQASEWRQHNGQVLLSPR